MKDGKTSFVHDTDPQGHDESLLSHQKPVASSQIVANYEHCPDIAGGCHCVSHTKVWRL